MYRLFQVDEAGQPLGVIQPTMLRFDSRFDANIVRDRYRLAHGGKYFYEVFEVDAEGRIVK